MYSTNNKYLKWKHHNRMLLGRFGVNRQSELKRTARVVRYPVGGLWTEENEKGMLYGGNHGG